MMKREMTSFSKLLTFTVVLLFLVPSIYASQILHWPGNGNANDISGNNYHATPYNISYVPGVDEQGFYFNGVTGGTASKLYRNMPHSPTFSLSFWINSNTQNGGDGSYKRLFSTSGDGYEIAIRGAHLYLYSRTPNNAWSYIGTTNLSEWNHVVITHQSSTVKCYINGELVATLPNRYFQVSGNILMGRRYSPNPYYEGFRGSLDEIKFYSNVLTPEEVVEEYDSEAPVITLLGDNPTNLFFRDTYVEAGYTVSDNRDSNPTVEVTGTVNTEAPSTYILTYTATDASGNIATAQRTVTVNSLLVNGGFDGSGSGWGKSGNVWIHGSIVHFNEHDRSANGSISQYVTVVVGQQYRLEYDYCAHGNTAPGGMRVRAHVGPTPVVLDQTLTASTVAWDWQHASYTFTAQQTSTRIWFGDSSIRTYQCDLHLNNATLIEYNPPTAVAGSDITEVVPMGANATVTLDASGTINPEGIELSYSWSGPFGSVSGISPMVQLDPGIHTITLSVDDGIGPTVTDDIVVTVAEVNLPINGLIGYWPADGDASDVLGNADGTLGVTTDFETGLNGQAFSFDAAQSSNMTVPLNISPAVLPEMTMGMFVKLRSIANSRGWVMTQDDTPYDRSLILHDDRYASKHAAGVGHSYPSTLPRFGDHLDRWVFIAVSYSGNSSTIYFNDLYDSQTQTEYTNLTQGFPVVTIGGHPFATNHGVDGLVDEVFIYDRFLTQGELDQICDDLNPNLPPLADAGMDQSIDTFVGSESVTLDGSASSDPDNDVLTYSWSGPFGTAGGIQPTVDLDAGVHTLTLTVDDHRGGIDTDEVIITINQINTIPIAGYGTALDFDGQNDHIYVPPSSSIHMTEAVTLEAWAKIDAFTMWHALVTYTWDNGGTEGGYELVSWVDNKIVFRVMTAGMGDNAWNSVNASYELTPGTWYHIVGTYDGTNIKLFIDGEEVSAAVSSGNIVYDSSPYGMYIARYHDSNEDYYLDCAVDEVRLWNTALDVNEIQDWMYRGIDYTHANYDNLAAYYKLDEGQGVSAGDYTGTNPGTLYNMDPATDWIETTIPTLYTDEDTPGNGHLVGSDEDGDVLIFSASSTPSNGLVDVNPDGSFTYTPNANWNGIDSFNYQVSDGVNTSNEASAVIHVRAVNDPPIAVAGDDQSFECAVGAVQALLDGSGSTDVDGDDLYYTWSIAGVEVSSEDAFMQTLAGGSYTYTMTVSDGTVSVSDDVVITVDEINMLSFNGANQKVSIANSASLNSITSQLTLEGRFKSSDVSKPQVIFMNNARYSLEIRDSKIMSGPRSTGGWDVLYSNYTLKNDEWYHVAWILDGNQQRIYIDGVLNASGTRGSALIPAAGNTAGIGANNELPVTNALNFVGVIEEVRLWNTALTQEDILENMCSSCDELTGEEAGLVGLWDFNKSSGNLLPDRTSNGNAGTLVNMTQANWSNSTFDCDLLNHAPLAAAGEDQDIDCVVETTPVTFNGGTSSDPDDDVLSYSWVTGGVEVSTAATFSVDLIPGDHIVTLTVSDGLVSSSDDVLISILGDTEAPILTLLGENPGSTNIHHAYDDLGYETSDACNSEVSVEVVGTVDHEIPGDYTITYTATDAAGNASIAERSVTVVNAAPIAAAGVDQTIECVVGTTDVDLDGTGSSDADDDALTYSWSLAGTEVETVDGFTATLSAGYYTYTLTVSDGFDTSSDDVLITVVDDSEPPVITLLGDNPMDLGLYLAYEEAGFETEDACGSDVTVVVTGFVDITIPEIYTLTYTATDENGNFSSEDRLVEVFNTAPEVIVAIDGVVLSFGDDLLSTTIDLSTIFADVDTSDVLSFAFTSSNGEAAEVTLNESILTMSAMDLGESVVELTATDPWGESASTSFTLTVNVNSDLGGAILYATTEIHLKKEVEVFSGNILVNESLTSDDDYELRIEKDAFIAEGYVLMANGIQIKKDAIVNSDIYSNTLDNRGDLGGQTFNGVETPLFLTMPPYKSAAPGGQNITVNKNQEVILDPGSYGRITVKDRGTLTFTGGVYDIENLDAQKNSRVRFDEAGEVRVEETFTIAKNSYVGPAGGSYVSAADIIFYIDGSEDDAAKIEQETVFFGTIYAASGEVELKKESVFTGAIYAPKIMIDQQSELILDSYFNPLSGLGKGNRSAWVEPELEMEAPEFSELSSNYPNPFNPATTIDFALSKSAQVSLKVYDLRGAEVAALVSGFQEAGYYTVNFSPENMSSGIYLYVLTSGSFRDVKRMVYLK